MKNAFVDRLLALENTAFGKSARYGRLERFVELALFIFKGALIKQRGGQISEAAFGADKIEKLYDKRLGNPVAVGIRDRSQLNIVDRGVALQAVINVLKLSFSPSLAIYMSWKKRPCKIDTLYYATDHPYFFAFVQAMRENIGSLIYFQHGYYPDKFWLSFATYDVGYTKFEDDFELLRDLNPESKCVLVPFERTVVERKLSPATDVILVAIPDLEYLRRYKEEVYRHTVGVIETVKRNNPGAKILLRPHPLIPDSNSWLRRLNALGVPMERGAVSVALEKCFELILIVPSTIKYEAEMLGIKVRTYPPDKKYYDFPLVF